MAKLKKSLLVSGVILLALVFSSCQTKPSQNNNNNANNNAADANVTANANAVKVACTFEKPPATSTDNLKKFLIQYFKAINDQDYTTAYNLLSSEGKSKYGSEAAFQKFYNSRIGCIQLNDFSDITDINKCPVMSASLGIQCYKVELAIQPNPDWDGDTGVPTSYQVHSDPHQDVPGTEGEITELAD